MNYLRKSIRISIGWLYIPQIGVDEPILHGRTDTEYLNKGFDGKRSVLGSVFTFAHANENLSDPHICLFGHNMMSGQIFGKLDELTVDEDKVQSIYIYTPELDQWTYDRVCIFLSQKGYGIPG